MKQDGQGVLGEAWPRSTSVSVRGIDFLCPQHRKMHLEVFGRRWRANKMFRHKSVGMIVGGLPEAASSLKINVDQQRRRRRDEWWAAGGRRVAVGRGRKWPFKN